MLEFRKLIAFGKSSYVVSLPKKWIERNKMKKGDSISVDIEKNKLVLSNKLEKESPEDKTIIININGKSKEQIQRLIVPAYINNFKNITLSGHELKDKGADIRDILHGLLALEIMEQSSEKIIARDFLDMKTIDIKSLLRKMDNITRSMMVDLNECFKEKKSHHIWDRDKDINRLSYLLFRSIKVRLNYPSLDKPYYISPEELLKTWQWGKFIEEVGDNVKRIAKVVETTKFKKHEKCIKELLKDVQSYYTNTMKAYYSDNKELALKLAGNKRKMMETCNDLYGKKLDANNVSIIIEKIKDSAERIHHLGRLIYT